MPTTPFRSNSLSDGSPVSRRNRVPSTLPTPIHVSIAFSVSNTARLMATPRVPRRDSWQRPSIDRPIPPRRASWRWPCSIRYRPPSLEPLLDGDGRAPFQFRLDGEFVHQSPDARQSQAQAAGRRVTVAQHILNAANSRSVVARDDQ